MNSPWTYFFIALAVILFFLILKQMIINCLKEEPEEPSISYEKHQALDGKWYWRIKKEEPKTESKNETN